MGEDEVYTDGNIIAFERYDEGKRKEKMEEELTLNKLEQFHRDILTALIRVIRDRVGEYKNFFQKYRKVSK